MQELNLDASIQQAKQQNDKPFPVRLVDDNLFPNGGPILLLQVTWQQFQEDRRDHYKTVFGMSGGTDAEMRIKGEDFSFGIRLTKYVVGWEGISGDFNRNKLVDWFDVVPDACIAFANGLPKVLKQRQKAALQYKESTKKNS